MIILIKVMKKLQKIDNDSESDAEVWSDDDGKANNKVNNSRIPVVWEWGGGGSMLL